jgi:hypothetical protein
MRDLLQGLFRTMLAWFPQYQQNKQLAVRAETSARQLAGLPPPSRDAAPQDLMAILQSTCSLLEDLVERGVVGSVQAPPAARRHAATLAPDPSADRSRAVAPPAELRPEPALVGPPAAAAPAGESVPGPDPVPDPEPSATARELIRLRDWVLSATRGGPQTAPEALRTLYRELGEVLEKEGMTLLEESGPYNWRWQEVLSTRVTDDPSQDETVCSTVRPGYLFHGKLVRPQQVIVYTMPSGPAGCAQR